MKMLIEKADIVIEVRGGVSYVTRKPPFVSIEIIDHDCTDDNGLSERYMISRDEVI